MIFSSNSSRSFARPARPSVISASTLPSFASSASSEHREIFGLPAELLQAGDEARKLGPLADDLLRTAVVLPEGRLGHVAVERGEPLLLGRDVKDGLGARSPGPTTA
jgi:hypothetical protein